ncbi:MAG: CbiX/SirB N-terminal domain-containing protein [Gemmatimonadota bacterium]|nr:CbiX/SirB N-terminal domain-containing protein [Gemmatimonadota bacterium]
MLRTAFATPLVLLGLSACAGGPEPRVLAYHAPDTTVAPLTRTPTDEGLGVLLMAHGGSEEWNASVTEAVASLGEEVPTEIAFGMADPETLQSAVDRLEARGVRRIAVVRLFVSGESFLARTRAVLGLSGEAGAVASDHRGGGHGASSDRPAPIRSSSLFAVDPSGLVDAHESGDVLRSRAQALSRDPASESVLLLGHGNGAEDTNSRLLTAMRARAAVVEDAGFHDVRVETLREDWEGPREEAERRIRAWVRAETDAGRRVIVVPFRLSGFGPYADVLEGLDYVADGLGLLPHPAIPDWIARRVVAMTCGHGWEHPAVSCDVRADRP